MSVNEFKTRAAQCASIRFQVFRGSDAVYADISKLNTKDSSRNWAGLSEGRTCRSIGWCSLPLPQEQWPIEQPSLLASVWNGELLVSPSRWDLIIRASGVYFATALRRLRLYVYDDLTCRTSGSTLVSA